MDNIFTSMKNFRDLGGHMTSSGVLTRFNVLARSDLPRTLTRDEVAALAANGFTTIVDLRTPDEVLKYRHPLDGETGFTYYNLKLDNWLRDQFYTCGETAMYYHMLLAYGENVKAILSAVADADSGVVFNCYSGKDRTGTIAALLLMLAGVPDSEIIDDYHKTYDSFWHDVPPEKLRWHRLIPHKEAMEIFLAVFKERYGCARDYCLGVGVRSEDIKKIVAKLVG